MRRLFLIALFLLAAFSLSAQSTRRHALVIGNGDYVELGKLKNPVNDARDIAAALRELGFEAKLLLDADLVAMEEAVELLGADLARSPDSVGFFYYAGHGIQSDGYNFLIPADARIISESYLRTKALAAQSVMESLQRARNVLNVVILDACRDNPFSWGRSGTRGLSVVSNQPPGSIIAYATSAGSVAQDGNGRNGVFTAELLANLRTPNLEIKEVFNRTGKAVTTATAGKQVPAVYNQFFDEAYLAGRNPSAGTPSPAHGFSSAPAAPSSSAQRASTAELVVSADREGAEVWVDGAKLGTTPSLFSGLLAGREILVEVKDGPYSASKRLTLKPGEAHEISFTLKLGTGNLFFQLPNAGTYRLWLDGSEWGQLSAAGLAKDIGAGEHEAALRGEGLHWTDRVKVEVGVTTAVKALPWEVGTVIVELPGDASFRLTRQLPGGGAETPARSSRGKARYELLPAGRYGFEAWGPGYESHGSTVDVAKGEVKRIEPWTTGSLVIRTEPAGAELSLGGRPSGSSPLRLAGLSPGEIEVTAKSAGYAEASQRRLIEAGKSAEIVFKLERLVGSIRYSIPEGLEAILSFPEGPMRLSGSGVAKAIPVGTYSISIPATADYDASEGSIEVQRGATALYEPKPARSSARRESDFLRRLQALEAAPRSTREEIERAASESASLRAETASMSGLSAELVQRLAKLQREFRSALAADSLRSMVLVRKGSFTMGSPKKEVFHREDEELHEVVIGGDFFLGKCEVTQREWTSIMKTNPSRYTSSLSLPVDHVSWFDAIEYCNRRSLAEGLEPAYSYSGSGVDPSRWPADWKKASSDRVEWQIRANGYRLPTEAEWEYACRAGSTGLFAFGNAESAAMANYMASDPSVKGGYRQPQSTVTGGTYKPNAWGLYDMHGNVEEWCWDGYSKSYSGYNSEGKRVLRGGYMGDYSYGIRSARRNWFSAQSVGNLSGFRVARNGQ